MKSFYHYLLKHRNHPTNPDLAAFAENAFYDNNFPKQEKNYHRLSEYLEMYGHYLSTMAIFDEAFQLYKENA